MQRSALNSVGVQRLAFTLIELLVVLAIIGVLTALLLNAIQRVRQAANQIACQNNLKQLGIALHGFHDANKHFPQGISTDPAPQIFGARSKVWPMEILPHIEQQNLDASFDHSLPYMSPQYITRNVAAFQIPVPVFYCPADGISTADIGGLGIARSSRSNYVACFSADGTEVEPFAPQDVDTCCNDPAINPSAASGKRALFNVNVRRGIKDITDGVSNTVALSEIRTGPSGSQDLRGLWWSHFGMQYTHYRAPNSSQADALFDPYCDPAKAPCLPSSPCITTLIVSARSYHFGGVNVVRADGAVHFVNDHVSLSTWQALASISSGEAVSEP